MYAHQNTAGNITNERYEVKARMRRFLKIITSSQPNKETTRWREPQPKLSDRKKLEQRIIKQKILDESNERMRQNLLKILNEERVPKVTHGHDHLRAGRSGIVTDCHPAQNNVFKNLHSRDKEFEQRKKEIDAKNLALKRQLEKVKPTIMTDSECREDYKTKARLLVKGISHTVLHLGLLKEAVKTELEVVASISGGYTGSHQHALRRPNTSSTQSQSGARSSFMPKPKPRPSFYSSDVMDETSGSTQHASSSKSSGELEYIRGDRPQTTGSSMETSSSPTRQLPKVQDIVNKLERKLMKIVALEKGGVARKGQPTSGLVNTLFGKPNSKIVPMSGADDDKTDEVSCDLNNSFNEYSGVSDFHGRPYYGQSAYYNHTLDDSMSNEDDKDYALDHSDHNDSAFTTSENLGELTLEEERAIQDITNALEMCLRDTT